MDNQQESYQHLIEKEQRLRTKAVNAETWQHKLENKAQRYARRAKLLRRVAHCRLDAWLKASKEITDSLISNQV